MDQEIELDGGGEEQGECFQKKKLVFLKFASGACYLLTLFNILCADLLNSLL